ncbi:MAG: T9SS type A sorting domain-containing protein [Bacteroidota bacterium]|nr:T9SS type A sorting domain-containing protein [Bacteroidota bacterium]
MKRTLLLFFFIVSFSLCCFSQDNKAFAITGSGTGDFIWMNIRQIDLSTGTATKNLFEKGVSSFQMFDAATNKEIMLMSEQNSKQINSSQYPTATMVAAAAYDRKHDKLFFTPMSLAELRWLDLSSDNKTPKFYTIHSSLLLPGDANDEANHITRMTIGADGNGYALTNDGNHLIKFSTGKKIVITDLGALVDGSTNNQISVHNKCSSWGGDVVADAFGKLYLFTASKNIFKIDVENKIATYLGSITGLSGAYTVNGAAVDNNDNVIISCANTLDGFYKVNMKDYSATKLTTTGNIYNSSDLANSNLLYSGQLRNTVGTAQLVQRETIGNEFISIYPNPVFGSQFKVTFDKIAPGNYTVALTDIAGKLIMNKQVYVNVAGQVENVQLKNRPANGVYLIKITDSDKKSVFSDKVVFD